MRTFITILTVFILLGLATTLKAQIACEDAISMARVYERQLLIQKFKPEMEPGDSLIPYLLNYLPNSPSMSNLRSVSRQIHPNVFLSPYIPKSDFAFSASNIERKKPALSSFVGSIDVPSTVITGLTDFLVERTKEELNIAFFQRFQAALEKHEALSILFPETADELATINTNIYQFNYFIQALRTKFYVDLRNMPSHLATLMQQNHLIKDLSIGRRN